jgi:hypothetical protein
VGLLGSLGVCERAILVVIDVIDDDLAVLGDGLDGEGTLVGFLDDDVYTGGERLGALGFFLLGNILLALIDVLLVSDGAIFVVGFRLDGIQVGNGEGDLDAEPTISSVLNYSLSIDCLRLIAKGSRQHNLLLAWGIFNLKGSILEVLLDTQWHFAVIPHLLLHRELGLELGSKLIVNLACGSFVHSGCGESSGGLCAERCP